MIALLLDENALIFRLILLYYIYKPKFRYGMSKRLWKQVEELNWTSDGDYRRIEEFIKNRYGFSSAKELAEFVNSKYTELNRKFESDWLGDPGIACSDDSWSDLRYEVVARGQEFFETITTSKLQDMALDQDYQESFAYCFTFLFDYNNEGILI